MVRGRPILSTPPDDPRPGFADTTDRYADPPATEVVREHLAEVTALAGSSADFAALAHINYAARHWRPATEITATAISWARTAALRALTRSGRAMETNTSGWLPLDATLLTWRRQEGGQAVSLGSDAHDPFTIGHQVASAAPSPRPPGPARPPRTRAMGTLLTGPTGSLPSQRPVPEPARSSCPAGTCSIESVPAACPTRQHRTTSSGAPEPGPSLISSRARTAVGAA
jgi:hypothetical protein